MTGPTSSPSLLNAAGSALSWVSNLPGALLPRRKPLHARGHLSTARVRGLDAPPSGVAWFDHPATDRALVRTSRAMGLPTGWPDVDGVALRMTYDAGHADVLLASTGWGRLARHALLPRLRPGRAPLTSLLPYETAAGPRVVGAAPSEDGLVLHHARPGGPWTAFAVVELQAEGSDHEVSFDPVGAPPPGLGQYRWVEAIREPAYRRARNHR